jgi:aminoglycoside phosphotransferase (APT) family kinase protein
MNKRLLVECLETLRRIQALKHSELDPSVTQELARVTDRLQLLLDTEHGDVKLDQRTVKWILANIGKVAVALDWIRRLMDR